MMRCSSNYLASILISFSVLKGCRSLITPDSTPIVVNDVFIQAQSTGISWSGVASPIDGTYLLVSMNENMSSGLNFQKDGFQKDTVVRILDGNTIKLQKAGVVSIAGARYPTASSSNFQFSECSSYGPTYKLRLLIPAKTEVWIKTSGSKPQAVIFRLEDSLNVNQELVKSGFAKAKPALTSDFEAYLDVSELKSWEEEANRMGLGIFKQCGASPESSFTAEFEPLDLDIEIQWGDYGGKRVVKQKESTILEPPRNPGDVKGCSDFETYEDALSWFEYYKPFYGDVAKLYVDNTKLAELFGLLNSVSHPVSLENFLNMKWKEIEMEMEFLARDSHTPIIESDIE